MAYRPILETCVESDVLAYNQANDHQLNYVECIKGYQIQSFPDGGYHTTSQIASGYIVKDGNNNISSNLQHRNYNNIEFEQAIFPDAYFLNEGIFIDSRQQIFRFKDDKLENLRKAEYSKNDILAYDNGQIYFLVANNLIKKENLETGTSSTIIDLSNLERDKSYSNLYYINVTKKADGLVMLFDVHNVTKQSEHYSLNLKSGVLKKLETTAVVYGNDMTKYNLPPRTTFSLVVGKASAYNLTYDQNRSMNIYKLLLFLKTGRPSNIPGIIGAY